MSLQRHTAIFWRYATVLRFGMSTWVAQPLLDEARDEIESIARHSRYPSLKQQAADLLAAWQACKRESTSTEQALDLILGCIVSGFVSAENSPHEPGPQEDHFLGAGCA